jgi:hypothetical protein
MSPKAIVEAFDGLRLVDVYAVIAYYLGHQEEVEAYLRRLEQEAADVRSRIEAGQPARTGFWDQLKARQARAEGNRAPAGE